MLLEDSGGVSQRNKHKLFSLALGLILGPEPHRARHSWGITQAVS